MKVLVYSVNFAPETTGIGKYSGEMCAWLATQGHKVRAVSAPPYYPNWKVDSKYSWPPYRREVLGGVDVWRAPIWVPKSPTGLTRILHLLSFAVTSLPVILRQVFWTPDIVIVVVPAFVCAPAALICARLCGAQAWLHVQDFEVDIAIRMNLLRGSLLRRIVLRMERFILRRFDVVSSISGRMAERLLSKGVEPENVRYFPNWVDVRHINPASSSNAFRAALGISDEVIVALFSGSLGGKQGLAIIPEAARLLSHRQDIVFIICGSGMMKERLEAQGADLPNLRFIPLQPFSQLGDLLCMADIHLLPQNPTAADLVLPSKLSGMFASGRPVIATCQVGTELHTVVEQCGLVVPPGKPRAFADAICALADDSNTRLELGKRARSYAEKNFERDSILERVFATINDAADVVPNPLADLKGAAE